MIAKSIKRRLNKWFPIQEIVLEDSHSKKVYDILEEKDYRTFQRIIGYLDYYSPGEYLKAYLKDLEEQLDNPIFALSSDYATRRFHFLNRIVQTRTWAYKKEDFLFHEPNLINKLNYGLIEQEFKFSKRSPEFLRLRLKKYKSLFSFLKSQGQNYDHYEYFIESIIADKEYGEEDRNYDLGYNMGLIYQVRFELESDRELFNMFVNELYKYGFISDVNSFKARFILVSNKKFQKSIWNKGLVALLFLIELFRCYSMVEKSTSRTKGIVDSFRTPNKSCLNRASLDTLVSRYKIQTISPNNVEKYVKDSKSQDIKEIFEIFSKIYKGTLIQ